MRHTKPKQSVQAQRAHDLNAQTYRNTLLALLNGEKIDRPTATPITSAMRDLVTSVVVKLKGVNATLGLVVSIEDSAANEIVDRCLTDIRAVNDIFHQVQLMPTIGLDAHNRTAAYRVMPYFDPAIKHKSLEDNRWKLHTGSLTLIETKALLAVGELMERGDLEVLRLCQCGLWYFAVRSDQKSHSPACRQRRHTKGDDFNKNRRARYALKAEMAKSKKQPRKTPKTPKPAQKGLRNHA